MNTKLYRSENNKMLAGVLGGIAENFNLDPSLLRLIYVIVFIFTAGFPLLILYIAAAVIIPKKGVQ
ncbi:phage shock protein C (PspC) family protein [Gracilibacillus ureilyticus]|uniref:Phage shock protein C (PspC) family protein n=1 Tax=Gracilibacillus ureilyticus TaxID=531814 RepID=A0A1H9S7U2_9BACI|nr:PspC domain-containing protein [Gracilibacillus ureilyticus]SER81021.1 phage shock protein C (PspC) family protein [Gracilibacillus ureilyticus]